MVILATAINSSFAKLGKLLFTGTITPSSTNITVTGLSQYSVFFARMLSDGTIGVAVGLRSGSTDIRFVGISTSSGNCGPSHMNLQVSGDTVVSCIFSKLATGATGLSGIRGII